MRFTICISKVHPDFSIFISSIPIIKPLIILCTSTHDSTLYGQPIQVLYIHNNISASKRFWDDIKSLICTSFKSHFYSAFWHQYYAYFYHKLIKWLVLSMAAINIYKMYLIAKCLVPTHQNNLLINTLSPANTKHTWTKCHIMNSENYAGEISKIKYSFFFLFFFQNEHFLFLKIHTVHKATLYLRKYFWREKWSLLYHIIFHILSKWHHS